MSEIQSIAQNNYILATQQEVSHDNTLSGNGTVDSPLGVVPGYNETVLWEGTMSGTLPTSITLSEPVTNFEKLRIQLGGNYKTQFTYDSTALNLQVVSPFVGGGVVLYCIMFVVDSATRKTISLPAGGAISFQVAGNGITGFASRSEQNVGEIQLTKVIGINRKAQ